MVFIDLAERSGIINGAWGGWDGSQPTLVL